MSNIKIVEKNDSISWEKITEVIHDAYEANERLNLHFSAIKSTPEENSQKILDGKCFLAMDGKEVAGLVFLRCPIWPYLTDKNGQGKWYCDKSYGMVINLAVREKYKGQGIGRMLLQRLIDECKQQNLESIMIDTSSKLKWLNKFYASFGFKKVDFISWKTTNYYTIVRKMSLNGKEVSNVYRIFRYIISKIYTIIVYNKNGQKRFRLKEA